VQTSSASIHKWRHAGHVPEQFIGSMCEKGLSAVTCQSVGQQQPMLLEEASGEATGLQRQPG